MDKRLYRKNTFGVTFASFGHCIFISLTSMALPMFLTDVMFINPATVSTIFLATRIWDAINDPLMGVLVDRTNTKWGKCRPYLLYGAVPLLVLTTLMFMPHSIASQSGKFIYAMMTYMLFITAFTAIDIPLAGIKPLLFTDPDKRNKAMSFSSTFGSLGSLLAVDLFFAMVVIFGGGNDKRGYFITVLFLSLLAFTMLLVGFFMTREIVPLNKRRIPFITMIKTVFKNKHLLIAIGVQLMSIGVSAYGILLPYFSKWNLANMFSFGQFSVESVLIPVLSTATGVVYMIAVMATPYMLKLASKRKMFFIMSVLGVAMNIVSFIVGYNNILIFIAIRILAHIPPTVTATITGYMVMDCLDYEEYRSGERTEGISFAVNNFSSKLGNAVFSSMVMLLLGLVGYNAVITEPALSMGESMAHNFPEMLRGIFMMMTVLPAIALVLQMIPMCFYKLSDKRVNDITLELKRRREVLKSTQEGTKGVLVADTDTGPGVSDEGENVNLQAYSNIISIDESHAESVEDKVSNESVNKQINSGEGGK